MNLNFEMAGYFAEHIKLKRSQKSFLEKIGFKITSFNLNDKDHVLSLKISVALEFDDVKDNQVDYMIGFILKDLALQHEILACIQDKSLHENIQINEMVSQMAVVAYPFLRAHLFNLTLDNRHPVQLPLFDLGTLTLKNGLDFKQKMPDFSKIS
ncbi:MAG: hypothetical protein FD133_99 [Erysipelotrichaceae bacterium]|nr:MAG: hypothetical protein FD179_1791 [Erysipelotrichaceae bacterium]TXT19980.1 MAG: hypothetical protein FD133_99 [Erysipelotrichaceae bacterium]